MPTQTEDPNIWPVCSLGTLVLLAAARAAGLIAPPRPQPVAGAAAK